MRHEPNVTEEYAQTYPDTVQQMLPAEDAIVAAVTGLNWEEYTAHAHYWFPLVQMNQLLCCENPQAQNELRARVNTTLAAADGVAFDGFGFRNHYACYCPRCQAIRERMAAEMSIALAYGEGSLVFFSLRALCCYLEIQQAVALYLASSRPTR